MGTTAQKSNTKSNKASGNNSSKPFLSNSGKGSMLSKEKGIQKPFISSTANKPKTSKVQPKSKPAQKSKTKTKSKPKASKAKKIPSRSHRSIGGIGKSHGAQRKGEIEARRATLKREMLPYVSTAKNVNGEVYFKDIGLCKIANNKIQKDKKNIGNIEIKKSKTEVNSINFEYTFNDQKYSGDLLKDDFGTTHEESFTYNEYKNEGSNITKRYGDRKTTTFSTLSGEGSYLILKKSRKRGKKTIVSTRDLVYGPGGWILLKRHMKKGKVKGYSKYGGGTTLNALVEMLEPEDGFTFEELLEFDYMSRVESAGKLQGLNSYDSEKMSFGFIQFTLAQKIQLWYKKAEEIYGAENNPFKKFGIDKLVKPGKGADFKKLGPQFQSRFWSARFYEAGLDKEMLKAQLKTYQEKEKGKYTKLKNNKITNTALRGMLLEIGNNRSAFISVALAGIKAQSIVKNAANGAQTYDGKKLRVLYGDIYKYLEIFVGKKFGSMYGGTETKIENLKPYIEFLGNLNRDQKKALPTTLKTKKDRDDLIDSLSVGESEKKKYTSLLNNKKKREKLSGYKGIESSNKTLEKTRKSLEVFGTNDTDIRKEFMKKLGITTSYSYGNIAKIKGKIKTDDDIKAIYKYFWKNYKHDKKGFNIYDKIHKRSTHDFSTLRGQFDGSIPKPKSATPIPKEETQASPVLPSSKTSQKGLNLLKLPFPLSLPFHIINAVFKLMGVNLFPD